MKIDEVLSNRDGRLQIEGCDATELVARFGSPLHVVSETQVRSNVRRFGSAFAAGWPMGRVEVLPAVKANWNLAVWRILADEGCGADVYSEGELEIALRAGVDPARISVNGFPKALEHIRRTLDVGARLTIDSLEDVGFVEAMAPDLARKATVRVRLRPATGYVKASQFVAEGPMPSDLASLAYKSGLSLDEAIEAGRRLLRIPNVELTGFHQHNGRHRATTDWWHAQMRAYGRDIALVCGALGGYRPREIDIGGGFAIPRDPHGAAIDRSAPYLFAGLYALSYLLQPLGDRVRYGVVARLVGIMRTSPNQVPAPDIEEYARAATSALATSLRGEGIDPGGMTLQLEPGRGIHGNAGVHLCTVRGVKRQLRPLPWNIVALDTSEFFLTAGRFEHHLHDFRVAARLDEPMAFVADVTGRSCYADRLLSAVLLPRVEPGDVFAFLDTGAYQEGSGSNFNAMPRPATVLVKGPDACLIKAGETLGDVLSRERVPPRLERAAPVS